MHTSLRHLSSKELIVSDIKLEKRSRNGRKVEDVKVVQTEADAVKHEYNGYVRVAEPKAPKASSNTPAPS